MTLENLKISLRTDTLQNWTSIDPVLENGEMAIIKEDGDAFVRFKVGNGLSSFSQLPYINQHKLITDLVDTTKLDAQCISQGLNVNVSQLAFAAGIYLSAGSNFSQTLGINAYSKTADNYAFTWNGDDSRAIGDYYESHGKGTFNINPIDGISGLYIGNARFSDILQNKADVSAVGSKVIIDGVKTDLSIAHLSKQEYDELVDQDAVQSNVLYIVSGDYVDVIEDLAGNKISANLCCINEDGTVSKLVTFNDISSKADAISLSNYLPLSGGQMSGDITVGKDNQIVFGSNSSGTVVFQDPSASDFGIHLSAEEDGQIMYYPKYIFNDTDSGFNVEVPLEEGAAVIRSGDLYAALSSKADYDDIPLSVSQLENDSGYLTKHQSLSNYYTKSETSSTTEISTAFQLSAGNKVFIDDRISNISEQADLSVIKLSSDEYGQILDDVLSNAIYIVEDSYNNAFGAQIKNLAPGTDLSDAVNLEQLSNALSDVVIPTDLSAFTNSPGYTTNVGTITGITMNGTSKGTSGVVNLGTVLTAHQSLANYYKKTETSSAADINTALDSKADLTTLQNYYAKSETSSANEISTALENAGGGSSRYALVTAQLVSDNGSLTCAVDDQTITTIQVSSSATPIVVQLPTQPEDGARDFILRIEISSSAAPTFTFNGVNETIDFDSEDDDWAVMEPGLNLVSFTETKRGDGSSSGNGGGGSNIVYHTVTFSIDANYGSLSNPSDATRQVADGEAVGTLPAVQPTGEYYFDGWYTEQYGSGTQVTSSTIITADVTFYAWCWTGGGSNN